MSVIEGKKVILPCDLKDEIKSPPGYLSWSRLKKNEPNDTSVAVMYGKPNSSWSTADDSKFALHRNGDLEIKRMDKSLEGLYKQTYLNVTCYWVNIFDPDSRGIWT